MLSMRKKLSEILAKVFLESGYPAKFGEVTLSDRPDLCQFQCNGAFACGKEMKANPQQIARVIVAKLEALNQECKQLQTSIFKSITIAGPGFINLVLEDAFLAEHVDQMQKDDALGAFKQDEPAKIIIDYGGPNIGKPLHVGHLRTAIIGESLKRLARYLGHEVLSDVHLGDWGLQMGMIIQELQEQHPEWIYFDENFKGSYPEESPIQFADFEETYPKASKKAKEDPVIMEACRKATAQLQEGRPGYLALWKHFTKISVDDLKKSYERLFVDFDLWLGESDVQSLIPKMIRYLDEHHFTYESDGAKVIDISEETDNRPMPPFMVNKSDGSVLYSTTDLATIIQRVKGYKPDRIWYVTDGRQALHFEQLFRCAYKTKIAPDKLVLEYLSFGTMNGPDGKPFKTREGGVMKLSDLIGLVEENAMKRLEEEKIGLHYSEAEKEQIAHFTGIAALKFADLMNLRTKDYVFDPEKFSSFEGKTGAYMLYSTVRIKSILRKAKESGMEATQISAPSSEVQRDLLLQLTQFPDALNKAFEERAPHYICDFVYNVAALSNKFYHEHNVMKETDIEKRGTWLSLLAYTHEVMMCCLDLLGIKVPERL